MKVKSIVWMLVLPTVTLVIACSRSASDSSRPPTDGSTAVAVGPALSVREAASPAGRDSREPELFPTSDGRVILSWVQKVGEKRYVLRFSSRDAAGWSEARTVAEGENWFVNWADFPSVIALGDGSLAAHWLVKSGAGTYAYDVNIARSRDGGKTWSKPMVPHTDGTKTEHGFVSMIPLSDGRLGAVWLDGRNMKDVKDDHDEHKALPVSMTLRYAAIDGAGKLSDEAALDERVCECCQTSAALTSEGPIVAYRDRSEKEVRDISFVRWHNGSWTSPQPVHVDNWEINGCPVNGPSVVAHERRVAVAWYTEADNNPRVQIAFSGDAGATFGTPIRVDEGKANGRVDVLLLQDGSAVVCWLSGAAEKGFINARRIRSDGTAETVSVVAETDISRSSGFPRMARLGDTVHFAWTQFGKPSQVQIATADVSAFR